MRDVTCPYCGKEGEIEVDLDMEESLVYKGQCPYCKKFFAYQAIKTISVEVREADCLNGGEHRWWKWMVPVTWEGPKSKGKMEFRYCLDCGEYEERRMEKRAIPKILKKEG